MINHGRTLLANLAADPSGEVPSIPGEEVIDLSYRPLVLPGVLADVRRILYGSDPDRWYVNYRTAQLLSLVHAVELDDYLLAFDGRITYQPGQAGLVLGFPEGVTYTLDSVTTSRLFFIGSQQADDQRGKIVFEWQLGASGSTAAVELIQPSSRLGQQHVTPTFTEGLSDMLLLPGSANLRLRYEQAGQGSWLIRAVCRPQRTLGLIHKQLGELHGVELLFDDAEPYATFKNLWRDGGFLAESLAGVVLAYIYRLDERRRLA